MEQIEQVNDVLREIGADHVPQILVWNKIDAAGLEPGIERDEYDKISRVFISAHSGAGLDLLREAIVEAAKAARGNNTNEGQDEAIGFAEDELPGGGSLGGSADNMPTSTQFGPH